MGLGQLPDWIIKYKICQPPKNGGQQLKKFAKMVTVLD